VRANRAIKAVFVCHCLALHENEYIVLCAAGGDLSLSPERAAKSSRQRVRPASSSKLPQRRCLAALRGDPPRLRLTTASPHSN